MLRQVKNSLGLLVLQLRVLGTTQRALDLTREILCDQTHVRDPARVLQDKEIGVRKYLLGALALWLLS